MGRKSIEETKLFNNYTNIELLDKELSHELLSYNESLRELYRT